MKKLMIGLALIFSVTTAQADFFGGNDGEWKMGPSGPYWDESDWPVWTPMYWMEEMMDSFDDDDSYGSFGSSPYGGGYPQMGQQPQYGYPQQAPAYGYAYPQQAAPVAPQAAPAVK